MAKKQKEPLLEEADRVWRSLVDSRSIERAYMAVMFERGFPAANLHGVAAAYEKAARFQDLLDLARRVIADGLDVHCWYAYVVQSLVELGCVGEAEGLMPELMTNFEPDDPTSLLAAMQLYRVRGDSETESMLFHAGMKWVTYFKGSSKTLAAKRYGAKPADLAARFIAWLDKWTGIMTGDIEKATRLDVWGAWLDKLGAKLAGDRLEAVLVEEKRREAIVGEFAKVKDEKSAQAILERVGWFVTPMMVRDRRLLDTLCERAPITTFALLKQARANQHLSAFGSQGEEAVMLSLALSRPILFKELKDTYENAIRTGTGVYEQHADRARAALRLGLRDAALGHLADAMTRLVRYYGDAIIKTKRVAKEIHDLADFKNLHGDEAFEKLFVIEPKPKTATPKSRRSTSRKSA